MVEPEAAAAPAANAQAEPEAEKREIQILPPAESVRPAVSWESPSAARADQQAGERPTFRADRREDRGGPRPEGGERRFEGRDSRRDPYRGQPRDPRDEDPQYEQRPRREPNVQAEPAAPAPKGFLGWLKGLFGGTKPAEAAPAIRDSFGRDQGGERYGDGQRHRRRHRGGRGHGGNPQGYRGDGSPQGGERTTPGGEGENRGFDRNGGRRRRRHRGGQGRDRGGNPRSEGHQGGGAI
jgi:hypothetical protein